MLWAQSVMYWVHGGFANQPTYIWKYSKKGDWANSVADALRTVLEVNSDSIALFAESEGNRLGSYALKIFANQVRRREYEKPK